MPSSRALALLLALSPLAATANPAARFQQLEQLLPTPNAQRNAAGAPGPAYWQNRADHVIEATLDEATHRLTGQARITYHNA
ncbi:MAG: M1 family metallopeptidase, partial [Verrucomicrobia bacterium]|nr:M1 family metallopeptidase [Verrucomicrobiota bacterium]